MLLCELREAPLLWPLNCKTGLPWLLSARSERASEPGAGQGTRRHWLRGFPCLSWTWGRRLVSKTHSTDGATEALSCRCWGCVRALPREGTRFQP